MASERIHPEVKERRPTWDEYFMKIASAVSERATCPKRSVGAVIAKDNRLISAGYNGSPRGTPHCDDVGCYEEDGHCKRVIHAELNAIIQVAFQGGASTDGGTIYTTDFPCNDCAKFIIAAGIQRVVYSRDYHDPETSFAMELFKGKGIEVVRFKETNH
ncbi:MAG TPA: cytidine/deoxycytidylate deaminase family protein [Patescibacteria group bacterium]